MQLPPYLLVEASIVWIKQESIHQVAIGSSQQLNFNPLRTSDRGGSRGRGGGGGGGGGGGVVGLQPP